MTHQPTDHGPGHRPRAHGPAHLPRFRGAGEDAGMSAAREPRAPRRRWKLVALIVIVIAVFLAIVIMHAFGVGPKTGM